MLEKVAEINAALKLSASMLELVAGAFAVLKLAVSLLAKIAEVSGRQSSLPGQ